MWQRIVLVSLGVAVAHVAKAQSFNIDFDISAGGAEAGQGVPSSPFGAAANQPGHWNRLGAASHTGAEALKGLTGESVSATIEWNVSGGGAGGGVRCTGDYRLLLFDCTVVTVPIAYWFESLLPGRYSVTTYSIDRGGRVRPTRVTVPGAYEPVKISGDGSMPENQFIEGVTHSTHMLSITGNSFSVNVENLTSQDGAVSGIQVTHEPVPEPTSIIVVTLGVLYFLRKRA